MPKATTQFVCTACGYASPKWLGKCPGCGKFNTLAEEAVAPPSPVRQKLPFAGSSKATPLKAVTYEKYERVTSGIPELDVVLGGGIVRGSLVLVGGDPGVGKSTLLTQVASHLAKEHRVLYLSAEESCSQVKLRCERLHADAEELLLLNETCLENAEEEILRAEYVIVDSIQAVYTNALTSAAGSVGQVRECAAKLMRIAKANGITFFIVGHVTKEGTLAGPKVLEHIMDTVLYFEGERTENFKILRAVKNRFGSVQEVGVFEMTGEGIVGLTDYSSLFLSDSRGEAAGAVVTPSETGNRCMMVELQTLMCKTAYGLPRRMSLGIDFNRLVVLIAVLEKRCGLDLSTQDIYLNAMGGIRLNEPSADLAVCAALASADRMTPVGKFDAVFGEVGLTGEVRGVNFADKRVNECVKMGFKRVILPAKNMKACEKFQEKIELVPVNYVSQMIKALFPPKERQP